MEADTGEEVIQIFLELNLIYINDLFRFHYVKKILNGLKVKIEHFFAKTFK
jgi:hypothetical protein